MHKPSPFRVIPISSLKACFLSISELKVAIAFLIELFPGNYFYTSCILL